MNLHASAKGRQFDLDNGQAEIYSAQEVRCFMQEQRGRKGNYKRTFAAGAKKRQHDEKERMHPYGAAAERCYAHIIVPAME